MSGGQPPGPRPSARRNSNTHPATANLQQARLRQPPGVLQGIFSCHQPHQNSPNPISQNLKEFLVRGNPSDLHAGSFTGWLLNYQAGLDTVRALTPRPGHNARIVEIIRHDPVQPKTYYFVEDLRNQGKLVRVYYEDGHGWRQQGLGLLSCALLKCEEHNVSWEVNVMG